MPLTLEPILHPSPQPRPAPSPPRTPTFVLVGPLRAGTTMLRLMLHHHSRLALVGEFEESVAMLGDSGWPNPGQYHDWLATHRAAGSRGYALPPDADDYQAVVNSMWDQLAARHVEPMVGCTIHSRIDRVLDLWPDTRLICLVRDPRDVCRSCVGMGWHGHPAHAAGHWLDPMRRWEQARARLPQGRTLLVRYEDLLRQPEQELSRCCDLLGVEFEQEMLGFHEHSTYDKLDPSLAEQWRRKMDTRTAEIIDARCMPMMTDYGYQPSTPRPRDASGAERVLLALKNRAGRLRWRTNRYGLSLVLQWALAKRLPITNAWRLRVRRRINDIDTAHLR